MQAAADLLAAALKREEPISAIDDAIAIIDAFLPVLHRSTTELMRVHYKRYEDRYLEINVNLNAAMRRGIEAQTEATIAAYNATEEFKNEIRRQARTMNWDTIIPGPDSNKVITLVKGAAPYPAGLWFHDTTNRNIQIYSKGDLACHLTLQCIDWVRYLENTIKNIQLVQLPE